MAKLYDMVNYKGTLGVIMYDSNKEDVYMIRTEDNRRCTINKASINDDETRVFGTQRYLSKLKKFKCYKDMLCIPKFKAALEVMYADEIFNIPETTSSSDSSSPQGCSEETSILSELAGIRKALNDIAKVLATL